MTLEHYQTQASIWLDKLRALTQHSLEELGDTSDTCQKISIFQAINELQARINGVEASDLKAEKHNNI